jgi:hypothetical protein
MCWREETVVVVVVVVVEFFLFFSSLIPSFFTLIAPCLIAPPMNISRRVLFSLSPPTEFPPLPLLAPQSISLLAKLDLEQVTILASSPAASSNSVSLVVQDGLQVKRKGRGAHGAEEEGMKEGEARERGKRRAGRRNEKAHVPYLAPALPHCPYLAPPSLAPSLPNSGAASDGWPL